jgi:hypothetical protein
MRTKISHGAFGAFVVAIVLTNLLFPAAGRAQQAPQIGAAQSSPQNTIQALRQELRQLQDRLDALERQMSEEHAAPEPVPSSKMTSPAPAVATAAAVQAKEAPTAPFSDADWTWLNGNPRNHDAPLAGKYFTPEIRVDANYNLDFNHPSDDTIGGSSEIFRSNEVQIEQLGVGGDLLYDHVHVRLMTQFGMYSVTTPRNDASPARGQWDLDNAYRYISEGYGGYHWDKMHGVNLDAGIFMSYVGLFSYYNFDNWAYQPSFVSSNTPWFFNGIRAQFFPTAHLKIEPWFINGWQSYGRFNSKPGLGGQIKWTPTTWLNVISNNYGYGEDSLGNPNRSRLHTDNSVEIKYFDKPAATLDRLAFSVTADAGCETGNGVSCHGNSLTNGRVNYKQSFVGWMMYNRAWFHRNRYAVTIGGGQINNPGRYLVLLPPINGATAITGTPYFTENPGDRFHATDGTITYDFMPREYITFRTEYGYRHANVPYWTGRGGITPPGGSSAAAVGNPAHYICLNGGAATDSGVSYGTPLTGANSVAAACGGGTNNDAAALGHIWFPDLRRDEQKLTFALMVKF